MIRLPALLLSTTLATPILGATVQAAAEALASQYGLTTSTTLPFPTATQSSAVAQSLITSDWSLGKGRIQDGPGNLAFVNDPFPDKPVPVSSPTSSVNIKGPVLEVTYPSSSFSHDTGGSQWYNLWNSTDGSTFGTMMISYEVAFDAGFDWVKGGKLPGLRGGLNSTGCSGGNEATGQDCFSTRLMWRKNGAGEVYAYIPSPNNLCSEKNIVCNSDFGISISRGSFGFVSGQWNRITLLVQLNDPPGIANGNVQLFYNDLRAISQQNLQIRSSSTVTANGFYFSTFFGGSDSSWATPQTTHAYFRGFRMWASSAPSNLTGQQIQQNAANQQAAKDLASIAWIAMVGMVAILCL